VTTNAIIHCKVQRKKQYGEMGKIRGVRRGGLKVVRLGDGKNIKLRTRDQKGKRGEEKEDRRTENNRTVRETKKKLAN